MLVAFIAVVSVQWIWIKYSMREGEDRFRSKVYDVLGKAVNLVEDVNNLRIFNEVQEKYAEIERWNNSSSDQQDSVALNGDMDMGAFSYGIRMQSSMDNDASMNFTIQVGRQVISIPRNGTHVNRDFVYQLMKSSRAEANKLADSVEQQRMMDMVRDFVIRYMKERDPQNANVQKRLENTDLDLYLKEEISKVGINKPFKWNVMTDQQIVEWTEKNKKKNFYYVDLFQKDLIKKDARLCIMFNDDNSLFYDNMGWMFIASGFCIVGLMTVFIISIMVIMRQQKLSVIKNDFINNMTHEFKTPLATISLATSAIEKEKVLNDKAQLLKFNTMIRNENERMNKYVERILLQAKLDRREVHLNKVNVNLNVLVGESVEHFRLQVEERGGVIGEELDLEGYVMQADEVHMLNVVCNLIDNAIKYSHDSLNIFIYTKREGNRFIIGVRDTGIGIPKEAQDKVFKRFYRVPSGNLHNVKGFGLGLSYAKSIVELHGGEIRLTSKKNKGTLVEIIFRMENL